MAERLPSLVVVLFAVLLFAELALNARAWVAGRASRGPATAAAAPDDRSAAVAAQIAAAHLFGTDTPVAATATAAELKLRGTIALARPTLGFGLISTRGGRDLLYGIGERLPDGALLREVHADHVLLDRAGRLELLSLAIGPRIAPRAAGNAQNLATATAGSGEVPAADPSQHVIEPEPSPATRALQVHQMESNGVLYGYTVGRAGTALAGLGPRDVVTAINGVALTDGLIATRMFDAIAAAGTGMVTVRDGEGSREVAVNAAGVQAFLPKRRRPPQT